MRLIIVAIGVATLAGCSVEDVRQRPPVWSVNYSGQFDDLANCLVAQTVQEYVPGPQIYQRDKRAIVTVSMKSGASVLGEYDLHQVGDNVTRIDFRAAPGPFGARGGRQIADRCGKPAGG